MNPLHYAFRRFPPGPAIAGAVFLCMVVPLKLKQMTRVTPAPHALRAPMGKAEIIQPGEGHDRHAAECIGQVLGIDAGIITVSFQPAARTVTGQIYTGATAVAATAPDRRVEIIAGVLEQEAEHIKDTPSLSRRVAVFEMRRWGDNIILTANTRLLEGSDKTYQSATIVYHHAVGKPLEARNLLKSGEGENFGDILPVPARQTNINAASCLLKYPHL